MRRLFTAPLFTGAVLAVIACGEQPTAPVAPPAVSLVPSGCNPVQAAILVHGLFAKYPVKEPTAKALLSSFLLSLKTGKPLTVQKAFLAFMKFVLASRDENLLGDPDGSGPLDANTGSDLLLRNLAACAGIALPNNFSNAIASGGDAKVIGPEGGRLKTEAERAGLLVRPKPGSTGEFLYTVAPFQRTPAGGGGAFAAASESGSCLGTTLREVGECFSYEVFPHRTFEDGELLLAICDPPSEGNPEHDFVRLARKRNGPGETGADIYPRIVNSSDDEMGGLHLEGCHAESPPSDIAAAFRPFLGENRANAVARFVGQLTRVFTPKPLYAGDALSASPRLLSIWTGVLPERQFSGAVTDDGEEPSAIAGATVRFFRQDSELLLGSTTTADDGTFISPFLPTGNAVAGKYQVLVSAENYAEKTLSDRSLPFGRNILVFPPPEVRPTPDLLVEPLTDIRLAPVNSDFAGIGTATVDGSFSATEWAGATCKTFLHVTGDLAPPGDPSGSFIRIPVTLCIMNDEINLYASVRWSRASDVQASLILQMDKTGDGTIRDGGDDWVSVRMTGTESDFSDLYTYVGCGSVCANFDVLNEGNTNGAGAASNNGTQTVLELSHPLNSDDLNDVALSAGSRLAFRVAIAIYDATGTSSPGNTWPTGGGLTWLSVR